MESNTVYAVVETFDSGPNGAGQAVFLRSTPEEAIKTATKLLKEDYEFANPELLSQFIAVASYGKWEPIRDFWKRSGYSVEIFVNKIDEDEDYPHTLETAE